MKELVYFLCSYVFPVLLVAGVFLPMRYVDKINRIKLPTSAKGQFAVTALLLSLSLLPFFWDASVPTNHTVFSNDGPLGTRVAAKGNPVNGLTGCWNDLNWLGLSEPVPGLTVTTVLNMLCFSKALVPAAVAGLGALAFWLGRSRE